MQEKLKEITRWIITQPPLFLADKSPISDNPFSEVRSPINSDYDGNPRLGFIYQEMCNRLFDSHNDFEVLAEEVQLFSGKETIGAIDFLLKHHGHIEHWEVAIKFYLLKGNLWYGPDSRDRLDKKLNRMLTHQLTMSEIDAFQLQFPHLQNIDKKLLMQGRLYTNPFQSEAIPNLCLGYTIQPENIQGNWCYFHQIERIGEPLYRIDKIDWIAGTQEKNEVLLSISDYSVHCQTESGKFWFVVPDKWPHFE